ncbi:pyruvate formate lyase 1-activating protein, partial [Enterococcus faecalis]
MTTPVTGRIHSTENFGTVDGPGVRFFVFTKGCRKTCQISNIPQKSKNF